MRHLNLFACALFALSTAGACYGADQVRYFEKDGVTYRETSRTVTRPTTETRVEERQQTVYQQRFKTEFREVQRTIPVAITEYRLQTCWERPFINPFAPLAPVQRLVPVTRWESRREVIKVPQTRCEVVPKSVTIRVPVSTQRMVTEEQISRVAVDAIRPKKATQSPKLLAAPSGGRVGGLARYDRDPPRYGVGSSGSATQGPIATRPGSGPGATQWRPANKG